MGRRLARPAALGAGGVALRHGLWFAWRAVKARERSGWPLALLNGLVFLFLLGTTLVGGLLDAFD